MPVEREPRSRGVALRAPRRAALLGGGWWGEVALVVSGGVSAFWRGSGAAGRLGGRGLGTRGGARASGAALRAAAGGSGSPAAAGLGQNSLRLVVNGGPAEWVAATQFCPWALRFVAMPLTTRARGPLRAVKLNSQAQPQGGPSPALARAAASLIGHACKS